MLIWNIAIKDLYITIKDKKALAIMLLMPLLIIIILGIGLGSMFTSSPSSIEKFNIVYIDNDKSDISKQFTKEYLLEFDDLFQTKEISSTELDEYLKDSNISAILIIPENFGTNITSGNKNTKVEIKTNIDKNISSDVFSSIIDSYVSTLSTTNKGVNSLAQTLISNDLMNKLDINIVIDETTNFIDSNSISFNQSNYERPKNLEAIEYYSAAMLVMFMLFGASQGTKLILEEKELNTLSRLLISKSSSIKLLAGKFLGLFIICTIQSIILILFTHLVYGVIWGNYLTILLITLLSVFASASFGIFIAAISKTSKSADTLATVVIQIFTLIGGGMIPIYVLPNSIKVISYLTPNYWAMSAYHNIMLSGTINNITINLIILFGIGFLLSAIGIIGFKTRIKV